MHGDLLPLKGASRLLGHQNMPRMAAARMPTKTMLLSISLRLTVSRMTPAMSVAGPVTVSVKTVAKVIVSLTSFSRFLCVTFMFTLAFIY